MHHESLKPTIKLCDSLFPKKESPSLSNQCVGREAGLEQVPEIKMR